MTNWSWPWGATLAIHDLPTFLWPESPNLAAITWNYLRIKGSLSVLFFFFSLSHKSVAGPPFYVMAQTAAPASASCNVKRVLKWSTGWSPVLRGQVCDANQVHRMKATHELMQIGRLRQNKTRAIFSLFFFLCFCQRNNLITLLGAIRLISEGERLQRVRCEVRIGTDGLSKKANKQSLWTVTKNVCFSFCPTHPGTLL